MLEIIEQRIKKLGDASEVSLADLGLSPCEVDKILQEKLGYERGEWDTNGWQGDNWISYSRPDRMPLSLYFCAWDFDIKFINLED